MKDKASIFSSYPSGAVSETGQSLTGRCTSVFSECTYYLPLTENDTYNSSNTYYKLIDSKMTEYQVQITGYIYLPSITFGNPLSGYFIKKQISNGNSINGLYDKNGKILSGNCTNSSGCESYELVQYYDAEGNVNRAIQGETYYYLPTRDTNIIVMNESVNTKWSNDNKKPFTLTSVHNKVDYTNSVTWDLSSEGVTCYNDTTIENIKINSEASNSTSTPTAFAPVDGYMFANYQNLKIGRGIKQVDSYKTFNGIYGFVRLEKN